MELFIKKAKLSVLDKFEVTDSKGNIIYEVRGELISAGRRLRINDAAGTELAEVYEKKLALRDKYVISSHSLGEVEVFRIDTMRKVPEYRAKQKGWTLKGDFAKKDLKIMEGLKTVAHIKPKALSFGETLKVEVKAGESDLLAVALYMVSQLDGAARPEGAGEK